MTCSGLCARIRTGSPRLGAFVAVAAALVSCSASPPTTAPVKTTTPAKAMAAPLPPLTCSAGMADCDQDRGNACESRLDSSSAHCGACGNACAAGEGCVLGECRRASVLTAADDHACVLLPSGGARCWGDNHGGELGDGTNTVQPTPVDVKELKEAVAIRTGEFLSCAVLKTGKLQCWGSDRSTVISSLQEVVDVAVRRDTYCAVYKTGEVRCAKPSWSADGRVEPSRSPEIDDAVGIAAGSDHTCALLRSGEVVCWGDPGRNGGGKEKPASPDGDAEDARNSDAQERRAVKVKGITDAVQITSTRAHTCALRKTGKIACWGRNSSYELGDGGSEEQREPVHVQLITDAVEVAAGDSHTCAVRKTGEVACWGERRSGELGSGELASSNGPSPVKGITDAIHVTAGEKFSCAMRKSGAVVCWGSAERGRLGNGSMLDHPMPAPVEGVTGAVAVTTGNAYGCALHQTGTISCWGRRADEDKRPRGVPPMRVLGIDDAIGLHGSSHNVCAVRKSGDAVCWHGGLPSGLKDEENAAPHRLLAIKGLDPVKKITDSTRTSVALLRSGQVLLWRIDRGFLGSNKPLGPLETLPIAGLSDVVEIATADDGACAVRQSGKVACLLFSMNSTFAKEKRIKPGSIIEIPGIQDAVHIDIGAGDVCVVHKTGEVTCFDLSEQPAPGEKSRTKKPLKPQKIDAISDATEIAMGAWFKCALLKSGEVACWGMNDHGELGAGDFEKHFEPMRVKGLQDAVHIDAFGLHVCAVRKGGGVVCWGNNNEDVAGHKDPPFSPVPVQVVGLDR